MRLLIFDSNKVYANKIKALVEEHVKDAEIELACNIPILRHRLEMTRYDLILADVETALDTDVALALLNGVAKVSMVVIWTAVRTAVTKTQVCPHCDAAMVIPKVFATRDINSTLDKVMSARCHA